MLLGGQQEATTRLHGSVKLEQTTAWTLPSLSSTTFKTEFLKLKLRLAVALLQKGGAAVLSARKMMIAKMLAETGGMILLIILK